MVGIENKAVTAAALRPGAVLGEVDAGLVNFVSNLDDIARGEVAGYNAKITGKYRQLFPRLSREDYLAGKLASQPEEPGVLDDLLGKIAHIGPAERASFKATRKVVRQQLEGFPDRFVVVPRVEKAASELEILDAEALAGYLVPDLSGQYEPPLEARRKTKNFTLASVMTDADVSKKYVLTPRAVETAKRVAVTDPQAAALIYQDMMNRCQDDVAVTVRPGDYSKNRATAANVVRQICQSVPRNDVAVSSMVSLNKIFMFGPRGEEDWHVSGPLKDATSVSYIYWLVMREGYIVPSALLGMELVLLGIDIYDGLSCAEPEIEYHSLAAHSDKPPSGVSSVTASRLSVDQAMKLRAMRDRLLPVYGHSGDQLATSVRVTEKCVLVNSHVVEADPYCTVEGKSVVVHTQLSRDLWSVKCTGNSQPWSIRDPVVNESVVIVYLTDGTLSVSDPLRVTSVDEQCIVTNQSVSVTYGLSGGALVALSDFHLLGIHSASTQSSLLSYRFGAKQFAEMLETDSASAFSRRDDPDAFGGKVAQYFSKRGMRGVLDVATRSLETVFSGQKHVGTAVTSGGYIYTTCDPDMGLSLGEDRRQQVFETVSSRKMYRTRATEHAVEPAYSRTPNYYEAVFVLCQDDEGVYMSCETKVVLVGADGASFVLADVPAADKPLTGGLVMAWDGAFLGCCGSREWNTSAGVGYTCWAVPKVKPRMQADPRERLSKKFPFLHVAAWPDALLEEIFTHVSVGAYSDGRPFNAGCKPLANRGDNFAKMQLYSQLREISFPHSQWASVMQSLQSNVRIASMAWEMDLADLMVTGGGTALQKDSKAYADMVEALIGAASLQETEQVAHQLCDALGLLYKPRPAMSLRSASEYAI